MKLARRYGMGFLVLSLLAPDYICAQKPKPVAQAPQEIKPPDPRGRPDEKFVNVPVRYYVWYDSDGWHLRTASRATQLRKFHGKIKLTGGTFNKLRAIGLEQKGKYPDSSKLDAARTTIEFTIYTSSSFDGYDFTVKGGQEARVAFELYRGDKERPGEIYIGSEGQHPTSGKFSFPAVPTGQPQ
jgi:hypothetical protein